MTTEEIHQYIDFYPLRKREPVFRGTNIRVSHIIDDFATGMSFDEVLSEDQELTKQHLQACFVHVNSEMEEMKNLPVYSLTGMFPFWKYLFPKRK